MLFAVVLFAVLSDTRSTRSVAGDKNMAISRGCVVNDVANKGRSLRRVSGGPIGFPKCSEGRFLGRFLGHNARFLDVHVESSGAAIGARAAHERQWHQ